MCSFCALRLSFRSLVAEDQVNEREERAGEVAAEAQGHVDAEPQAFHPPGSKPDRLAG
jgi:hypothetical protein